MTPLALVRGGDVTDACSPYEPTEGWSDGSVCPTTTPTNCKPCSG